MNRPVRQKKIAITFIDFIDTNIVLSYRHSKMDAQFNVLIRPNDIEWRWSSLWTPAQRKRASMLYFANVFIFFFYGRLISGPGEERRFAKVLHVVDLECHWSYYLDFFLKLQGGPKSDEISHIFRPRPQTFCSHARTRQNILILK